MKLTIKGLLLASMVMLLATASNAQEKGQMAAGGNLVFGFGDDFSNVGIGAKFQYNLMDNLRLEPSFTFFLKKDHLSMWDISVNAHYILPIADKLTAYPLAGIGMFGWKVESQKIYGYTVEGASDSNLAFNIGGGADYALSDNLLANVELKYKVVTGDGDFNRFLISLGVSYLF